MSRRKQTIILPAVPFFGIADKGRCIGRAEDGRVVFAQGAVPGDVADVLVLKKKKDFYEGVTQGFQQLSADRREPFCEHFGACGGCKWQHLDYTAQAAQKAQVVENALTRIGKVPIGEWLPIIAASSTTGYRNKLEFSFSNRRWLTKAEMDAGEAKFADVLGFHPAGGFDKVIDIRKCWLMDEPSNLIRNAAREIGHEQGLSFYNTAAHEGFLRTLMLRITTLGQTMVLMSFGADDPVRINAYLGALQERVPRITTIVYCINTKLNDSMNDLEMIPWSGPGYVEEMLGGVRFRIGPKSFFQTNTRQAEALYNVVLDFAGLRGHENVYDLYTGIGSIALYMARHCRQVTGIEEIAAAIEDARINAALNNIHNTEFYAGDVRHILTPEFAARHGKPDLLVTDPPRAGMHEDVANMLLELESPKIVYVSCDPSTQARDLNRLHAKYDVLKVQPVDMFPHTHHIENVALLQLR